MAEETGQAGCRNQVSRCPFRGEDTQPPVHPEGENRCQTTSAAPLRRSPSITACCLIETYCLDTPRTDAPPLGALGVPVPARPATGRRCPTCRVTSADCLPAVASAPVDAPARFAPELSHPRQDRPRPFGRRAPADSPRVRLLVSVRGEDTQHRSPGRRHTDAPLHQEERTRVATTLARRRRSGDARRAPREPAVDRLTTAELFIFDAPRRDRL